MSRLLPGKFKGKLIIGLLVVIILLFGALSDWIMEWLWLDSLGYEEVFWTIKKTQILLTGSALLVVLAYVIPNIAYLVKRFPTLTFSSSPLGQFNLEQLGIKKIRVFLYTLGTLISVFFSMAFFMRWDTYFRFHWNEMFEVTDPIFGHDLGFYIFRLPFIELIQDSLIIVVFFVTAGITMFYLFSGALTVQDNQKLYVRSDLKKHLGINAGIWLILLSWGYYLERYRLLYNESGVVFGAGYVEMNVMLPVLWVMCILALLLAITAFYGAFKEDMRWLIRGGIVAIAVAILGQGILPTAVQNFVVDPSELELESPYLENNIELTRQAYGLSDIKEREYDAKTQLTWEMIQNNEATIQNIRLWDPRLLIQTYRQLQEIRLYYQFYNVDVDRYHTNEGYQQMMVSARELSDELPEKANTWVNRHLQYTHGYGLVMSPVAQIGSQGDPRLVIKDLPPVSEINLQVEQPSIYYGNHNPDYKLVNTDVEELDYPRGDENVYTNYQGKGGVSINSFFEKLLFAWQFGDINLLLTSYIKEGSRIQFWKRVKERVRKIAPFLHLEDEPYLVLSEGKLFWIVEAYTTTPHYPYSEPFNRRYNYIRNSVKVVVDAYHGTVDFYSMEEEDPILDVYKDIFPNMFKPLEEMPESLKQHLRYPQHLFNVQIDKYNTYHMTTPQVFYNNEDLWTSPREKYGGQQIRMEPYYVLSKLPGGDDLQYMLISPITPSNRDNMIAWISAKSDFPDYGEVEVFKLPKERLILGPAQIEAKIDQDTDISRQLSLWDQRGSSVIRGNLMIIPIEDSFIYVEPVFLIAEGVDIPQLQRVIVTVGERVTMEPTLDAALRVLFDRAEGEAITRDTVAIPPLQTQPATTAQLSQFKTLWNEAQQALRDGDWQLFGEKMKEIEELLEEKGED